MTYANFSELFCNFIPNYLIFSLRTFWKLYSELFEKCLFYVKNLMFSRIIYVN